MFVLSSVIILQTAGAQLFCSCLMPRLKGLTKSFFSICLFQLPADGSILLKFWMFLTGNTCFEQGDITAELLPLLLTLKLAS